MLRRDSRREEMSNLNSRLKLEQELWDSITEKKFADDSMLRITYPGYRERFNSSPENRYIYKFLGEDVEGKKVLDCGCGSGVMSVVFALGGAEVAAYDVSKVNLGVSRKRAAYYNLESRINFAYSAAERLSFRDESFDIVFGTSILHHTILQSATEEIARVLKPGGKAAFIEPLGTNPIITFARNRLSYAGKEGHGNDRPFDYGDIALLKKHFRNFQYKEFRLTTMLYKFFGRKEETFDERLKQEAFRVRMFRYTVPIDAALTAALPFTRRFCQIVAVLCEK